MSEPVEREAGEAFERALAAEQQRRLRGLAILRFVALSGFMAYSLGLRATIPGWIGPLVALSIYWVLSAILLAAVLSSRELAARSSYAIAAIDIPMVLALSYENAASLEAAGYAEDALAWRFASAASFMAVIAMAALALERRQFYVTVGCAVAAELALLATGGGDLTQYSFVALIMVMAGVGTAYGNRRAIALVRSVAAEQQRRRRLGRYFAPQIAARIESAGRSLVAGERREVTLLFCDARDFTRLSDGLAGEDIVELLNAFHERMVDAVFSHGGTLDKLMGDGLMAYFGAPVADERHAEHAVRCALAMAAAARELADRRRAAGLPALEVGIGVHTGTVVLGDIGAPQRRDYTVVGDAVNVAARVERLTRERDVEILVSEETRRRVGDAIGFRAVEPAHVKGKAEPVVCYEPLGSDALAGGGATTR